MNSRLLEEFEPRRQHAWNKLEWSIPAEDRHGRFLDIGCGCGSGLVAALQHGFESATGIDRSFKEFHWFDICEFDAVCNAYGVSAARATLIEGDAFAVTLQPHAYQCVLLLDSIEHVPNPRRFIDIAARCAAPGGYLFIDTAPLYYSKVGHHLWSEFPPETLPWAHLRRDWPQLRQDPRISAWSSERFDELNKVTHDQIRNAVLGAGLKIVGEHRDEPLPADVELLERHRADLDLEGIDSGLLFETWVLLVAKRPP